MCVHISSPFPPMIGFVPIGTKCLLHFASSASNVDVSIFCSVGFPLVSAASAGLSKDRIERKKWTEREGKESPLVYGCCWWSEVVVVLQLYSLRCKESTFLNYQHLTLVCATSRDIKNFILLRFQSIPLPTSMH